MTSDSRAVVLSGTGGVWRVRSEDGETCDVSLRGRLKLSGERAPKLAVGDQVTIAQAPANGTNDIAWTITSVLPRRSRLARREPGGRYGERVIVANLDEVVIVFAAANPDANPRMLDRFLVIAEANELAARIVINKTELVGESLARARFSVYEMIGYPVHYTSALTGLGLDGLRPVLVGRVSAFSGPSGVGKSSLLNAMFPGFNLRVGAVSEAVGKGQHTTVGARMLPLPGQDSEGHSAGCDAGYVVDTPGLREVGMWQLPSTSLDDCFPEFRDWLGECKFADCSHRREPGCAVRAAVERGEVTSDRYDSYCRLREELEEAESSRYR